MNYGFKAVKNEKVLDLIKLKTPEECHKMKI